MLHSSLPSPAMFPQQAGHPHLRLALETDQPFLQPGTRKAGWCPLSRYVRLSKRERTGAKPSLAARTKSPSIYRDVVQPAPALWRAGEERAGPASGSASPFHLSSTVSSLWLSVLDSLQTDLQLFQTGTIISAAAVGVAARTSATKSAMVVSVSCPTAETTGIRDWWILRATTSSLKAHNSSGILLPARQ